MTTHSPDGRTAAFTAQELHWRPFRRMTLYEAWVLGIRVVWFRGHLCKFGVPCSHAFVQTLGGWRRKGGRSFFVPLNFECEGSIR